MNALLAPCVGGLAGAGVAFVIDRLGRRKIRSMVAKNHAAMVAFVRDALEERAAASGESPEEIMTHLAEFEEE